MEDLLIEKMFEHDRWINLINKMDGKGISLSLIRQLSEPSTRIKLYSDIKNGVYEIQPARIVRIPKDNGDFREVHVNTDIDRCVLSVINDCLFEMFPHYIHPSCTSYQKGKGSMETVSNVVSKISKLKTNKLGYKADLSKYFDSVDRTHIMNVFDRIEKDMGIEHNPIITLLRKYYNLDEVYGLDGKLIQQYGSLKQGCAVGSFLANVILYDIDKEISEMGGMLYYRYSDDLLIIGDSHEEAKNVVETQLNRLGLKLNPNKVDALYRTEWFTFLGFNIKGKTITLSRNRVKKFQQEVVSRTIGKPNVRIDQAKKNVIRYLYEGDRSWALSCLPIINSKQDIDTMNNFIMDCLRSVHVRDISNKRGKKISISKIGGLGVVNGIDGVIVRGKGSNVKRNRELTNKNIENYISMGCLSKVCKIDKDVYKSLVSSI